MPKTSMQVVIGLLISLAWLLSLVAGLYNHDYEGLQLVTPVMLIYAGYVFGESFFQRRDK